MDWLSWKWLKPKRIKDNWIQVAWSTTFKQEQLLLGAIPVNQIMFKWKVGLLSYIGKSILTRHPKKENCHIQDLPWTVQVTPWGLPFPSRAACPLKCDNGYVPTGAAVCGAGRWHKACCCAGCWLSQTVRDFGKRSTGFKRFFRGKIGRVACHDQHLSQKVHPRAYT